MTKKADGWQISALVFGLTLVGCAPSERAADVADESPAAEAAVTEETAAAPEEETAGEPQADTPEATVPDAAPEPPGVVAPADDVEGRVMRNWVLLEFSRPVEEADLEWLEENGFRVDSVMSELRVRGWFERAEGGRAVANDPRIARVHTQMR